MTEELELAHDPEPEDGGEGAAGLDNLLHYLNESRGFDFSGYKRAGLERRLLKRVSMLNLTSFDEYVDYLEVHPDEFDNLFNAILINATSFFRDPIAWDFLAKSVVPQIIESRTDASSIRVWSAGCATGQEAYSIAMLLAEAMGIEAFVRKVKIYATDMDDDALSIARQATYTPKELASVPPDLLGKYFDRAGTKYSFSKDVRRSVIFGRHNLLHDAPISRIDLLLCRNTLMYFNAEAQARIMSSIHFALAESGVLFLGKAEMLLTHNALFAPLDLKRRMFTKITHSYPRGRIVLGSTSKRVEEVAGSVGEEARLREAAFEVSPIAQIGVNTRGIITLLNDQARRMLGIEHEDVGRALSETGLFRKVENLRFLIETANLERRPTRVSGCELGRGNGDPVFMDIIVSPIFDELGAARGVHISFLDVTGTRRMQQELQQATQDLESAYEELQAASEELETTNEELQSTVEELETTNEELQSTNEELETTNEEMQSTNEELQSTNETLRSRTSDLGRVNLHFESILASLRSAVVVLDLDLHVQVWSNRASDLWGLRAEEVQGKHFFGLDIGLPVETLRGQIKACIAGEHEYQEAVVPATNRRGRSIQCSIKTSRLTQNGQPHGVILLMDETEGQHTTEA
jgi:two-component system CheB/CheR fusion protein